MLNLGNVWLRQSKHWEEAFRRHGDVDWRFIDESEFTAAVDCPIAMFPEAMLKKYPNAKFIFTTRDAEKW